MIAGTTLSGRYLLADEIGRGGMGVVYRARDLLEDRLVAVKILKSDLMNDRALVERFQREATIAKGLRHPHIVGVLDHGQHAGHHYMVMELAAGDTLTLLMFAPMEASELIHIVTQLLDGLAHAHGAGLIHRDLKPDNIVVQHRPTGTFATLVDFGIAIRNVEIAGPRIDRLTGLDETVGTAEFMAPEQACGEAIDCRVDLFALGVISYALLAGMMPFDGSGVRVMIANMTTPVPPIWARAAVAVDPLLEAFTRWLLQKDRNARPASAMEAKRTLELIAHDRGEAARVLLARAEPRPCVLASLLASPSDIDFEPPTLRRMRSGVHPHVVKRESKPAG